MENKDIYISELSESSPSEHVCVKEKGEEVLGAKFLVWTRKEVSLTRIAQSV